MRVPGNRRWCGLLTIGLVLSVARMVAAAPSTVGTVVKPIVSLHLKPGTQAEVVTQAFLAEPVRILARQGAWMKVALPDQCDYPGWIEAAAVRPGAFASGVQRVEVRRARTAVRDAASDDAPLLLEAFLATRLPVASTPAATAGWQAVALPDGHVGYVSAAAIRPVPAADEKPTANAVIDTARIYMGVPYVWGGMSTKGVDCSGFTHTVYRFCGIRLHRDADQQFAFDGVAVKTDELRSGDLVFFKTYLKDVVSHVGFYIGGGRFIHASSRNHGVAISKLSEPYFKSRYAGARRILRQ